MVHDTDGFVLALYDFAAKQDYIFRTPKIKEISGASELLAHIYELFREWLAGEGCRVEENDPFTEEPLRQGSADAEILYEGGGNLMLLFRDRESFTAANRILSLKLLEEAPGLSLLACGVDATGNLRADIKKLYEENRRKKNLCPPYTPSAVLPVTQVDPLTFAPVTYKGKDYTVEPASLSADRVAKYRFYGRYKGRTDYSGEGMQAVIHIDGNGLGKKLAAIGSDGYEKGVGLYRVFSRRITEEYITKPMAALERAGIVCRKVIAGGDDLTLICPAKDAFRLMKLYFETLASGGSVIPEGCPSDAETERNTACAGIAVIHEKFPFSVAYDLAEAACDSAKAKAHREGGNWFDFYYCHAGVSLDFEDLRRREQSVTGRPYCFDRDMESIERCCGKLRSAGRANVKALNAAAQRGMTAYTAETVRVNAYLKRAGFLTAGEAAAEERRLVYDLSEFYDLWFSAGTNGEPEKEESV